MGSSAGPVESGNSATDPAHTWRSPRLAGVVAGIEAEIRQAWEGLRRDFGVSPDSPDETALA